MDTTIWLRVFDKVFDTVSDIRRVSDLTGTDMKMIFYSQVALVLDPNQDGYVTGIFSTRG
jgi:hypothetical protein